MLKQKKNEKKNKNKKHEITVNAKRKADFLPVTDSVINAMQPQKRGFFKLNTSSVTSYFLLISSKP